MSAARVTFLKRKRDYTHAKIPWNLEEYTEAHGETSTGIKFGWKLFHYISGGGMRTFGRTVRQDEIAYRQRRFLVVAALIALVWVAVLVF